MTENVLETMDPRDLGRELQIARSKARLTQQEAADVINVARTTITAIEKGERRIKPAELIKLAQAYNRAVSDFVRPRPKVEPVAPRFRSIAFLKEEDYQKVQAYVDELEELARNYVEIEQITKTPLVRDSPAQYEIEGLDVEDAAEDIANRERNRLGLGDAPIGSLRKLLEQEVGIRIFYLKMQNSAKFSEIYFYDEVLGACVALNSLHPKQRRRLSLAHAFGHFLAH
jgi:DNA-binding XRE family transcriptional regulator